METKASEAIALCRVSSDEQLKNNSLNRQNEAVMKTAIKYDVEIVKIWSGSVSSKIGKNVERKDLKEMLEFCRRNKKVIYLIVDEPDRFMRSIEEAFYFEVEFKKLDVQIVYTDDMLNGGDMIAKMHRFMKYFAAESSNEERIRKSISGGTKALEEGRYPFPPKFAYIKGITSGLHTPDPTIAPILQKALLSMAKGLADPTSSLKVFNDDIELNKVDMVPLKMDKWRKYCTDSYYAGVVEKHSKSIDFRNPNGLHDKLITIKQHEKIVDIFNKKGKVQTGPKSRGNPYYPLSSMIYCPECPRTHSKYNKYVGCTVNNGNGKTYKKYRCRGCYRYMSIEEIHCGVARILDAIDLVEESREYFNDALSEIWKEEEKALEGRRIGYHKTKKNITTEEKKLFHAYINELDPIMKESIKKEWDKKNDQLNNIQDKLDELGDRISLNYLEFAKFAMFFIDNLAIGFLTLSPEDTKKCKQILFPDGFCVDENRNVYTNTISPIYRLRSNKKDFSLGEKSLMVRVKRL